DIGSALWRIDTCEEDVGRLQVAMENAALVSVLDRFREDGQQLRSDQRGHRFRSVAQPPSQRDAGTVRRGDVADAIDLACLVNCDDVRMVESGRGTRFLLEACPQLWFEQHVWSREFQRHFPAEHRIERKKDDSEAAAAQFSSNLETAHVPG